MAFLVRVFFCIAAVGFWLYAAVDLQTRLTAIRIQIPPLAREVSRIEEANTRLRYEIEKFENPRHLLQLARRPEFGHLRFPKQEEVIVLGEQH